MRQLVLISQGSSSGLWPDGGSGRPHRESGLVRRVQGREAIVLSIRGRLFLETRRVKVEVRSVQFSSGQVEFRFSCEMVEAAEARERERRRFAVQQRERERVCV